MTQEPGEVIDPARDPAGFRRALGAFATGVVVVTTATPQGPLGITVNSFASLSLDPPLILWCPAKGSRRYGHFVAARHFAVHVLGAGQRPLAESFVRDGAAFGGLDWQEGPEDVPLIGGVLARFCCETWAVHEAGDHAIVIGRVTSALRSVGPGLVFQAGRWGDFGS